MEASAWRLPRLPGRLDLHREGAEERLVEGLRTGDERAFERVYDQYHRPILSFCRHMLGSREEAEDAVQQTFLAVHRAIPQSDKPILLRPWLYTVARNNCLSTLRARREAVSIDDAEPAVEGLSSEVQRREDLRQMLADMGRLPEEQRAALVLAELGDLTHDEIGDVVGCPREKVKALVFQARSSLAASRAARETPCHEIRQQLANLSGGALRRNTLRRHLRDCQGCQEFRSEVQRQRAGMAILLPVLPTAGLKASVLSGAGLAQAGAGAGAAATAGGIGATGTGLGSLASGSGAAKLLVAGILAAGAATGGVATLKAGDDESGTRSATPGAAISSAARDAAAARSAGDAREAARSAAARAERRSPVASAPGLAGTSPGQAGTTPGQAGTAPGRAGTTPGQAGTAPGQAETTPGQARTAPGRSGATPGQGGANPGQTDASPGRAGTTPGQSCLTPGQSGTTPGQSDITPGRPGTLPGEACPPPGESGNLSGGADPEKNGKSK